jgi:PDZ domain-containing protein
MKTFGCIALTTVLAGLLVQSARADDENKDAVAFINAFKGQHLKKDEFETTDAYQRRIASFPGKEFVVVVPAAARPGSPKAFSYDADTQTLTVRFVGTGVTDVINVVDSQSDESRKLGPQGMLSVRFPKFMLQRTNDPSKEYQGQSAMGAQSMVKQINSTEWSVAMVNMQYRGTFVPLEQKLVIEASRAKAVVEGARWRLYVTSALAPGQQDFVVNDGHYKKPTFDDPTEIVLIGNTIMGVLRRGELLAPGTDEVLATFRSGADYPTAPVVGARVLLGVTCAAIPKELVALAKLKDQRGCLVGGVTPDSVAAKANVRPGDVITAIDDKVIDTPNDLIAKVKSAAPGQAAKLTIWRGGQEISTQAQF